MILKHTRGMLAILMLLAVFTGTVAAQFTLSSTQARLGEVFSMSVSGAHANSGYIILIDKDPGPTLFPMANNLQVDLGFSANLFSLGDHIADGSGDGTINLVTNEVSSIGGLYYVQALNVDPTDPLGITASNQMRGTIHAPLPGTGTTTPLTLTDDGSALVSLGFSFPFYGQTYTEAYVNSNGTLSFGQANASFTISESFFLSGPPSIAALWSDLNPQLGGTVEWDTTSTPGAAFTARWTNINDNIQGGPNSFSISIDLNGHIIVDYGNCTVSECVSGITAGTMAIPNSLDLSVMGWAGYGNSISIYEDFSGGGFDLSNSYNMYANTPGGDFIYFR